LSGLPSAKGLQFGGDMVKFRPQVLAGATVVPVAVSVDPRKGATQIPGSTGEAGRPQKQRGTLQGLREGRGFLTVFGLRVARVACLPVTPKLLDPVEHFSDESLQKIVHIAPSVDQPSSGRTPTLPRMLSQGA
jgi:hypothetical protein